MYLRIATAFSLILIALAGCGDREPQPAGPPAPKPQVSLTFWHIMNYQGPREVIARAVRRFEAANPGVRVEIQTFDNDPYKTKLNIEMASGTPPDVFFTWGGGPLAALAKAGKALDLTDAVNRDGWRQRILPAPLRLCTFDNRVYALPLDLSCVPVWYNADLFAKHNLEPPKTFPQFLDACDKLKAAGLIPLALGNKPRWPGAFYFIYLAARTGGAELFLDAAARKPGRAFDDPAFIAAGQHLRTLVTRDLFSPGCNSLEPGDARTEFLNGEAAMYLMGTWLVARASKENPAFLPKLKCFPFPAVPGGRGDPTTVVGGVNCAFAVATACKHPRVAIDLLRFLTAPEVAAEWCAIGRIPALRADDKALANLPAPTRAARRLLQRAQTLQPYYDQYLPPPLAREHKETTHGLFAGTLTPAQAAHRMAQRAREKQ